MKRALLLTLFAAGCLTALGELDEETLKRLEDVEIAGIRDDKIRDHDHNKIAVLEVNTAQNEDDYGEGFRIRVVVELRDSEKNMYLAEFTADRSGEIEYWDEYTGEDYWFLYMPYGDLKRLQVKGYAVQYGYMDGETFRICAEEYDGAKTLEELKERTQTPFPGKIRMMHYYIYDDEDEGLTESTPRSLRPVRD